MSDIFDIDSALQAEEDRAVLAKFEEAQKEADLSAVLETPAGRRVLWSILAAGGLFRSSYADRREDTYFREGERNLALRLWANCQSANRELALRMLEENHK